MLVPGNPIKFASIDALGADDSGGGEYVPTEMPLLGEDTDEVLTDLAALTPDDLASLREQGVISP
jgi:hypothetical protein